MLCDDVELVWLEDRWVFDGVWFASSFFVVDRVVLEVYWIWAEVCDLDPFVCGVFAFWVWVDFCYLEHVFTLHSRPYKKLKFF